MSWPVFDSVQKEEFEQVVFGYNKYSNLRSMIAIHDTTLGPAFGGTRMMEYTTEERALEDVLQLAKAMTYKNAAAGINFGGGKAIIIGDPKRDKSEALLRSFGRLVGSLGGRYITGVDIGTCEEDMIILHQETDYNVSMPETYGGGGSTSAATAYGLFHGIQALVEEVFDQPYLKGKSIAIQGLGSIGLVLAESMVKEGCQVFACDIDEERVHMAKTIGVTVVPPEKIYDLQVDIFSPNALGGILHDETIPRLKCSLVAGAANNQLLHEKRHSKMLEDRKIIYGVDYILSAGGVINNAHQFIGYNKERAYAQILSIGDTAKKVYQMGREKKVPFTVAARELARERIEMARGLKDWYLEREKRST